MIKKLRQQSGETLIEALVSMLIAVLSMGILAMAVMASTNLNMQTREMDEKYRSQLNEVESLSGEWKIQDVTIQFAPEDGTADYMETVQVTLYGSDENAFLSYDYTPVNTSEEDTP